MQSQLGLAHFWAQGDTITHAVAILLLLLSVASWMVIVGRGAWQWKTKRCFDRAMNAFWSADSLDAAVEAIAKEDESGVFARMATAGASAMQAHEQHEARGIGAGVSQSESVTRALRTQIVRTQ